MRSPRLSHAQRRALAVVAGTRSPPKTMQGKSGLIRSQRWLELHGYIEWDRYRISARSNYKLTEQGRAVVEFYTYRRGL